MTSIKKIGILGGTFNPVHYGHLIAAENVREAFGLDRVLFMPSGVPPHKQEPTVEDAAHRFEMVRLAIGPNPFFEASRMEIDRPGFTYTVDTLGSLKATYGNDAELYFIIGADVLPELTTWRNFTEVFGLCGFIAVLRHGYGRESFLQCIEGLKTLYRAEIHIAETPVIDISSTDIRRRIKDCKSIKYLTPHDVEDYIYKNRLYINYI